MAVSHYNVYRDGGATPIAQPTTTSYSDTGLDPETQYSYTVSAVDGEGNESAKSSPANATTLAAAGGYDADVDALSPDGHWRLNETSGTTFADRIGGNDATAVNSPSLGVDPLVTGGNGSIGLKRGSSPAHATISDLSLSTVSTFDVALQIDEHPGTDVKFMVLDNGGGTQVGEASIELEDDGSSGLWVRCWSTDSSATPIIKRTNAGTVPIGTAFKLSYRRHADGTQSVLIDGVAQSLTDVSGTDPGSWPALKSGTWALGAYINDVSIDPFMGVISDLVVWDSFKSDADLLTLDKAQDIVWLPAAADAGEVNPNTTKVIDLARYAHPSTGFTVNAVAPNPSLGTHSVNGEDIEYSAGGTEGDNDTFGVSVTKGGLTSDVMTVTIDVAVAETTADMAFYHAYFGGRSTDVWSLESPQLATHVDTWDAHTNVATWQSKGVKVLHNVIRGTEIEDVHTTASELRDFLIASLTDGGDEFDGVIVDEISPASHNLESSRLVMDAMGLCKADRPDKLWAVFHTPNNLVQDTWDRFDNIDFMVYEAYQCCGSAGPQSECEPSVANITDKCQKFVDQGPSFVEKTIFIVSLAWPGQGSCDTRPSTSYFQLQIEEIKRLCPNAMGIGTASGTGGDINGIAYDDYDPIVRSVYNV